MRAYYVYILCSKKNGTLYVGVTNNLTRRMIAHKSKQFSGFTEKYNVTHLVYYERFESVTMAIRREKQLKQWNRAWKLELIEKANPEWKDLFPEQ